jgi:hypothetical protein
MIRNAKFHSSPSIIEIIQKWNGNIPSFIKIAMKIRKVVSLFIILKFKEVEIMIILEEIL